MRNAKLDEMLENCTKEEFEKMNSGIRQVLRDYNETILEYGDFLFGGLVEEWTMPSVLAFFEEVGMRNLVLIDISDRLMYLLHRFCDADWKIEGPVIARSERERERFGHCIEIVGLRLTHA